MRKRTSAQTIEISKDEYDMLKEIYKTVKRQRLLFRIEEASKNLKAGTVERVSVDEFIESI